MSIQNVLIESFDGIKHAFIVVVEQMTDIFGHNDTITLENSEIVTNEIDRLKISETIDGMIQTQLENARANSSIGELVEDVELQSGESITLRL